ncbi:hypothetical protein WEB32_00485 [Streptomyces netropsis]|uniref:hypothetical protein n=1 Tax=Streptomyces netropsis TaxID=55404 RepID=UPI0030D0F48A
MATEASTYRIAHDLTIWMADRDFPGRPTRQTSNFTPSQIGVFAAYATTRGRALVDRELYLHKSWTKGEPAKRLVLRALASDQFEAFLAVPNCFAPDVVLTSCKVPDTRLEEIAALRRLSVPAPRRAPRTRSTRGCAIGAGVCRPARPLPSVLVSAEL